MLKIDELNFGYNDAENYQRRDDKRFFNNMFLRTKEIDKLCENNIYFLLGEKGTGKTAYAMYLVNNEYKNTSTTISYIRETDYKKFLRLKKEKHLDLSDYTNIWKVIIYLLLAEKIDRGEIDSARIKNISKFQNLKKAIDEYYQHAFTPEIIHALHFVEKSKLSAELIAKYARLGGEEVKTLSFSENRFQTNLLYIQKKFEDALRVYKLRRNNVLFIDGIDIRPSSVPYNEYLECVKGLADAVWSLNNDYFSNIRDAKNGRLRVVIIIRPDIFDSLNLQNRNNKIRDNSVLLNWQTTYNEYRNSNIFLLVDKLLRADQPVTLSEGEAWDYYFPFDAETYSRFDKKDDSFVTFLRFSYYRPRDFVTMLHILQENFIMRQNDPNQVFRKQDFDDKEFRRKYADYLLGELKDHLSFYYSEKDYEIFLKFFEFLKGKVRFNYAEYASSYKEFIRYLDLNSINKPIFFESQDQFLQFMYDLNVISYIEELETGEKFFRWCFRERNPSNISPKIKTHQRYEIHYGLARSLNIGKRIK